MPRGEKKIDEWLFRKDGHDFKVTLHLIRDNDPGSARHKYRFDENAETPTASFRIRCPEAEIEESGKEIGALRKLAYKLVQARGVVGWKRKLLVEVEGIAELSSGAKGSTKADERLHTKIEIGITPFEIAEVAPGKFRHREPGRYRDESHKAEEGLPETGAFNSRWDGTGTRGLIDDTPENRAALDEISRGFIRLRDKLVQLLGPETIQATLAQVGSMNLLPAPPPPDARQARDGMRRRLRSIASAKR